jgi:hypothetical protein
VKSRVDVDADGIAHIHGTVVGLSVGGTYNAYVNADFRSDLVGGAPPAPASCPGAAKAGAGKATSTTTTPTGTTATTPPIECKYIYVRDDVPQGFGAVLLAASELEFEFSPRRLVPATLSRSK